MSLKKQARFMRRNKNQNQRKNKVDKSPPYCMSQFVYLQGTRYLCLSEQKNQKDLFYSEFNQSNDQNKIIKSYILDCEMSVVWEGTYKRNFQNELKQKQGSLQYKNRYRNKKIQISDRLCFERGIFELPKFSLPSIEYRKYLSLNDFKIGRVGYNRQVQCHKIASDIISKDHCSIIHYKNNDTKTMSYFATIKKILMNYTPDNSNFRKIPEDIWDSIVQFAKPKQKYVVADQGSRNCTYIYEQGTQVYPLQQNCDYQFQKQSYQIHICKIFGSVDTQKQSVMQHNKKANELIEQFKKQVNWNYYQRANKTIILQEMQPLSAKQILKIQILIFRLQRSNLNRQNLNQFYLLATNRESNKKYSVGCKHDININPQQYDIPSLHVWQVDDIEFLSKSKWLIPQNMDKNKQVILIFAESFQELQFKTWKFILIQY